MNTIQHSWLTYLAFLKKAKNKQELEALFKDEISYVLFPDGIRCLIGERQLGHFEEVINGPKEFFDVDVSWLKYPTPSEFSDITPENIREKVKYYLAPGIKPCVIGEKTNIEMFDLKNWSHPRYNALRAHLLQDCVLDDMVRKLVNCSERFSDKFEIKATGEWIDGAELRNQIAIFERLGALKLAEVIYKYTDSLWYFGGGVIVNQDWLDKFVKYPLEIALEELDPLPEKTYSFMQLSKYGDLAERIEKKQWEFTEEDKKACKLTNNLDECFDQLYSEALRVTMAQFNQI